MCVAATPLSLLGRSQLAPRSARGCAVRAACQQARRTWRVPSSGWKGPVASSRECVQQLQIDYVREASNGHASRRCSPIDRIAADAPRDLVWVSCRSRAASRLRRVGVAQRKRPGRDLTGTVYTGTGTTCAGWRTRTTACGRSRMRTASDSPAARRPSRWRSGEPVHTPRRSARCAVRHRREWQWQVHVCTGGAMPALDRHYEARQRCRASVGHAGGRSGAARAANGRRRPACSHWDARRFRGRGRTYTPCRVSSAWIARWAHTAGAREVVVRVGVRHDPGIQRGIGVDDFGRRLQLAASVVKIRCPEVRRCIRRRLV